MLPGSINSYDTTFFGDTMFKKMWNTFRSYFAHEGKKQDSWAVRRQEILDEYEALVQQLYKADTLAQLLELRKGLREFQQKLITNGIEIRGRPYVMELTKLWNAKYTYWKKKMRKI